MKINKLSISNFKCFNKLVDIDFKRLTILTGPNSSGKSTIINSLLGVLQSNNFPLNFSPNGDFIIMGDFKLISHKHNTSNIININLKFDDDFEISTKWNINLKDNSFQLYYLDLKSDFLKIDIKKSESDYIMNYEYKPDKNPLFEYALNRNLYLDSLLNNIENNKGNNQDKFKELLYSLNKPKSGKNIILKKSISEDSLLEVAVKEKLLFNLILPQVSRRIESFTKNFNFISSFRLYPERVYFDLGKIDLKLNKYGDGYLNQILFWENYDKPKMKELLNALKSLKLVASLKSKHLDNGRFDVLVKTKQNFPFSSLIDVGFGLSQFIPVLVADIQMGNDSTFVVSQPEIHLHPSAQSLYGEYISKNIKRTNKNYVIETHSEYFLNRIRLEIVKGNINPDDVSVYFFDDSKNEISKHEVVFTNKGGIKNAPKNFFKTYMMDVFDIANYSIKE